MEIRTRISNRLLLRSKPKQQLDDDTSRHSADEIFQALAPVGAGFDGRFVAWDRYALSLSRKTGIKPADSMFYKEPQRHIYNVRRYDNWKDHTPECRKANPRYMSVVLGVRIDKKLFRFIDVPREDFPRPEIRQKMKKKLAEPIDLFNQELIIVGGELISNIDGTKLYRILAPKDQLQRFLGRIQFQGLALYRKSRAILNQHLHMFATVEKNILRSEDVESTLWEIAWLYGTSNKKLRERFKQYVRDRMKAKGKYQLHLVSLPNDIEKLDEYDIEQIRDGWELKLLVYQSE